MSCHGKRYKGCITWDKYSFFSFDYQFISNNNPSMLIIFESAIDLISFMELCDQGFIQVPYNCNIDLLSMRGLQPKIVERFLESHHRHYFWNIFAVDNDNAGRDFVDKEFQKNDSDNKRLSYLGDFLNQYEGCKDWNDLLKNKELIDHPKELFTMVIKGSDLTNPPF